MKKFFPNKIYKGLPCSVVAVGCALGIADPEAVKGLYSPALHADGYLSLNGMNKLIRANKRVIRRVDYKRGERPILRDFCHSFSGDAVVCVSGHYIYVTGGDYYSFLWNGDDEVIAVWVLKDTK